MPLTKSYQRHSKKTPSTFALLIDEISNMSPSRQKALWMELNKEKVFSLAKEIDNNINYNNNLTSTEIDSLVNEARKYGRKKKKN